MSLTYFLIISTNIKMNFKPIKPIKKLNVTELFIEISILFWIQTMYIINCLTIRSFMLKIVLNKAYIKGLFFVYYILIIKCSRLSIKTIKNQLSLPNKANTSGSEHSHFKESTMKSKKYCH